MANNLFVKHSSTWREILRPLVKVNGVWQPIKKIFVKQDGVWKQVFGNSGSLSVVGSNSSSNTYSWVVPAGVYTVNATLGGAGGSGGDGAGVNGSPDGGEAGQKITVSLAVTPGETITFQFNPGGNPVAYNSGSAGITGGVTQIKRNSTVLAQASGGTGGKRANGSNMNGRNSSWGTGGAGRWGAGANAGDGGISAGGGGIDGKASGYYSGKGGPGIVVISWNV